MKEHFARFVASSVDGYRKCSCRAFIIPFTEYGHEGILSETPRDVYAIAKLVEIALRSGLKQYCGKKEIDLRQLRMVKQIE